MNPTDWADRLDQALRRHVDRGDVAGLSWAVSVGDRVERGAIGLIDGDDHVAAGPDSLYRIASVTKPVTAVAALQLVEEGTITLDEPVDDLLPELADRRVVAADGGPLDRTVPAARSITLHDLLTSRCGLGYDFSAIGPQPVVDAMAAAGVGVGPPAPASMPGPDEWMRRVASVPLACHPGQRWLYHTSFDLLGVLVARAAGRPLGEVMRDRIFEPLGMHDTGFSVRDDQRARWGPVDALDPTTGMRTPYDVAAGQWATPPAFESGGAGLVSTAEDLLRFGRMLLDGGGAGHGRVLDPALVADMTRNHLTPEQLADAAPEPDGTVGWGYGVGVVVRPTPDGRVPGSYGWSGGLGSTWFNDPARRLVAVLLTNQMWQSPEPAPVVDDFATVVRSIEPG